jgi:hypothetical protein
MQKYRDLNSDGLLSFSGEEGGVVVRRMMERQRSERSKEASSHLHLGASLSVNLFRTYGA